MIHVFSGETADEVWLKAADRLESGPDALEQASRIGPTRELLHTCFSISDPRQRWILARQPAINPAFAIAEVVWILSGRNDSRFLNHWNPALPKFAGSGDTYHGAYGYRLRKSLGIDQLEAAFDALRYNPTSRQVVLQIWDAASDLPHPNGAPRDPDIPCNICSMLKSRDGRLDWMQVLRSNDLFLGVPHNIVQFTSLQEVIAGWLGLQLGSYHQLSDSLHIYNRDVSQLAHRFEPSRHRSSHSLMLPKNESDAVWCELEVRMQTLASRTAFSRTEWYSVVNQFSAPEAHFNLFMVVVADDARRRGWTEDAEAAMSRCSDPVLELAWRRWATRKGT